MCQGPRALTQRSPGSGRPRGRAASTPQDALAGGPSPAQHLAAIGRLVAASSSLANIHDGSPYATANNQMQSGSLTIGGINAIYGGGNIGVVILLV